jgi:hypothetical protein
MSDGLDFRLPVPKTCFRSEPQNFDFRLVFVFKNENIV